MASPYLIKDARLEIAVRSDLQDVLNQCITNKEMAELCKTEDFWKRWFQYHSGQNEKKIDFISWKDNAKIIDIYIIGNKISYGADKTEFKLYNNLYINYNTFKQRYNALKGRRESVLYGIKPNINLKKYALFESEQISMYDTDKVYLTHSDNDFSVLETKMDELYKNRNRLSYSGKIKVSELERYIIYIIKIDSMKIEYFIDEWVIPRKELVYLWK